MEEGAASGMSSVLDTFPESVCIARAGGGPDAQKCGTWSQRGCKGRVHNQTSQFWCSFQGSAAVGDPQSLMLSFQRGGQKPCRRRAQRLNLENLAWPCHLLPGPRSECSSGALARDRVATGILCCRGRSCPVRTSCASLGGLSASFREVPDSWTDSHTRFI